MRSLHATVLSRLSPVVLALCVTACATMGGSTEPDVQPFPANWTVIDLTRPLDWRAPALPHSEAYPFERKALRPQKDSNWSQGAFTALEQMGTYLAAPRARLLGGDTVESLAAADLLLPVRVVDCYGGGAERALTLSEIQAYEVLNGPIAPGSAVVLRTGLGAVAPEDARYAGKDDDGALDFPGWSAEAARYLVQSRKVRLLGSDAPAIDAAAVIATAPAQTLAAESRVPALAGLGDLSALPHDGAFLVIGVLPIVDGTGAPCRVLALLPPAPPTATGTSPR